MNRLLCVLLVFSFAGTGLNPANAAEEIVHSVKFPQGDAAWSISFQTASSTGNAESPTPAASPSGSPPPRQVKKIDIVRKGQLRRDTLSWSDGSFTEYWWPEKSHLVLLQDEVGGRIRATKVGTMGDQRFDAVTFAWVGKMTFKGMKPFDGKPCRYYEIEVPVIDDEKETLHAWIDGESLKPVAWSKGGYTAIFSFGLPLPAEPLVMPEKFRKELSRIGAFFAPSKKYGTR